MPLSHLDAELARLAGFSGPGTRTASHVDPRGLTVEAEFTAVDSMSSAVREVRADAPALSGCPFATVEQWAADLTVRITYLLEGLGVIELDPSAGEVQIRSTPPDRQGTQTQYYEILLNRNPAGQFVLKRYWTDKTSTGRVPVDFQLTHDQLKKLIADLLATAPIP
ncbi:MAG: hypothetical protein AAF532_13340 [Planctomycetota bacterium]